LFHFAGIDLISGVSCQTVREWVDKTKQEWDFSSGGSGETFHVRVRKKHSLGTSTFLI